MSKKMKGVGSGSGSALSGDAKARFKHQTLLEDYQDLQKEAVGMRLKLDAAKQRKRELLAEVRFLRRRHRYLVEVKSLSCPQEQPPVHENPRILITKDQKSRKREATQFKLPPLPDLTRKERVYAGKGSSLKNAASALNLNRKLALQRVEEASEYSSTPASDLGYRRRPSIGNDAAFHASSSAIYLSQNEKCQGSNGFTERIPKFDLNLDTWVGRRGADLPSRPPTFDLNEVSMEEDEVQVTEEFRKFEEAKKGLVGAGNDEQHCDTRISLCRNAGEGPSRIGKRKISWQDPVALSV